MAISEFGSDEKITSVQEGLKAYFRSEKLDGDNQYHCEKCEAEGRGAKQDAHKGLKLTKVPYILSIGLKRFVYDWERDCRVKIDDEVVFPPVLDMAEFLDMDGDTAPEPEPSPSLQPEPSAGGEVGVVSEQAEEGTPPVEHCGFGTHAGLSSHVYGAVIVYRFYWHCVPRLYATAQGKMAWRSGQRAWKQLELMGSWSTSSSPC